MFLSSLDNFGIHKTVRNFKDKNDSFFDLYSSNNNINNYSNNANNNSILLKNSNNYEDIGVEMAHFRIIAIIQENKKLLNKEDK